MLLEISSLGCSLSEIKFQEWKFPLTSLNVIFKTSISLKAQTVLFMTKNTKGGWS